MKNLQILSDDIVTDQYGRQSLLSTYVQYQSKIPHPFAGDRKLSGSRSTGEELKNHQEASHNLSEFSGKSLDRKGKK